MDYTSLLESGHFTFLLGPDKKRATVQRALFREVSEPLNTLINGQFQEAKGGQAELKDVDQSTFARACEFIYRGNYACEARVAAESSTENILLAHAKLHVFADRYLFLQLKEHTLRRLNHELSKRKADKSIDQVVELARFVFENPTAEALVDTPTPSQPTSIYVSRAASMDHVRHLFPAGKVRASITEIQAVGSIEKGGHWRVNFPNHVSCKAALDSQPERRLKPIPGYDGALMKYWRDPKTRPQPTFPPNDRSRPAHSQAGNNNRGRAQLWALHGGTARRRGNRMGSPAINGQNGLVENKDLLNNSHTDIRELILDFCVANQTWLTGEDAFIALLTENNEFVAAYVRAVAETTSRTKRQLRAKLKGKEESIHSNDMASMVSMNSGSFPPY